MKLRYIIYTICLLFTVIGQTAAAWGNRGGDRRARKESATIELFSRKKQYNPQKLTFRCRIVRKDSAVVMQVRILRHDSVVHVAKPGIRFSLADGGSVELKPVKEKVCCGDWAAGRWNNVSFLLGQASREKLENSDVIAVVLTTIDGEIGCDIAARKQGALRKQLRSVE